MGVISRLILITHRKNFQVIRAEGVAREIGEREARHFWRAQAEMHLHSIFGEYCKLQAKNCRNNLIKL